MKSFFNEDPPQSSQHHYPFDRHPRTHSIMSEPCCPPGAIGTTFQKNDLKPKGKIYNLSAVGDDRSGLKGLPCYKSCGNCTTNPHPKRVILVFSDVFGIDNGNHKLFCDQLQTSMGDDTQVWMPDFFRGHPILRDLGWDFLTFNKLVAGLQFTLHRLRISSETIEADLTQIVVPKIREIGCQSVGVVGFCFGGWVIARCLALENSTISCGVGIHPSWQPEKFYAKPTTSEEELGERTQTKPMLLLPAKQDQALMADTDIVKALAERRSIKPEEVAIAFPEMDHGFVSRGDSSDPKIKEAQERALSLTAEFLKKHLNV